MYHKPIQLYIYTHWVSLVSQTVKYLPGMQETSISGLGRSTGEGNGNPLQYSCPENSMDRGAWWAYRPWTHQESDTTEQLILSLSGGWLISAALGWTQVFRLVLVCSIFSTLDSRRRPGGKHPSRGGSQELKRGKQEHKTAVFRTS